ncbi:MAG: hypothetical protein Q8S11_02555 [Daejeonella sp.]|uniref:hypothetical protein n=1 Tax=Daejeonella sp. TaxID=2805397 RepID=UPI0027336F51|nr:hypothetical protein [Daejeonella sp.]MDP3467186.1 hypothetical protein [Daejeonella sp.]
MRTKIHNSDDLRMEILRLRVVRSAIEAELKVETNKFTSKFRVPLMLLGKVNNWVSPIFRSGRNEPGSINQDWVTSIFKVGLPVVMNKFLFPRSGFLLKSVVELLSQNTAKTVNKDVVTDLINKVSDWIKSTKRKKKQDQAISDYGIPPDSETY